MDHKNDLQVIEELTDNVKTLHEENAKLKEEIDRHQYDRQTYIALNENLVVHGKFEAIFHLKKILEEYESLSKERDELNLKLKSIQALFL